MIERDTLLERLSALGQFQTAQWVALGVSVLTACAVVLVAVDRPVGTVPKSSLPPAALAGSAQVLLTAPPAVEPLTFRPIVASKAIAINAAIPIVSDPNPPALPFRLATEDPVQRARATDCMTAAIYYEANSERLDGQAAVAQVVLNRMRHPSFPKSVCAVVFQGSERATGCQFTFTCDGSLARTPDQKRWLQARRIAEGALAGNVLAQVGWSTHYHTQRVVPYWSPTLRKTAVIGAHIFYRLAVPWGAPRAFASAYGGDEPAEPLMAALTPAPLPDPVVPPTSTVPSLGDALVTPMSTHNENRHGPDPLPAAPDAGDPAALAIAPALPGKKPDNDAPKYFPPSTPKRRPHLAI